MQRSTMTKQHTPRASETIRIHCSRARALDALIVHGSMFALITVVLLVGFGLFLEGDLHLSEIPLETACILALPVFFGSILVKNALKLFDKRPWIIISDEGLFYRGWALEAIPWMHIQNVRTSDYKSRSGNVSHTMYIDFRDIDRFIPDNLLPRIIFLIRKAFYRDSLVLDTSGLEKSQPEIFLAIYSRHRQWAGPQPSAQPVQPLKQKKLARLCLIIAILVSVAEIAYLIWIALK